MYTSTFKHIISFYTGNSIYISEISPLCIESGELQSKSVDVVLAFLEENYIPSYLEKLRTHSNTKVYYFSVNEIQEKNITRLFSGTYKILTNSITKGLNILITCRNGISISPTILTAFFTKCLIFNSHYVISCIKEMKTNWVKTFLHFIQSKHIEACPNPSFMEELFIFEKTLFLIYTI